MMAPTHLFNKETGIGTGYSFIHLLKLHFSVAMSLVICSSLETEKPIQIFK